MTKLEYLTKHGYNIRLKEDCPDLFMKTKRINYCTADTCEDCWNQPITQEDIDDLYPPEDFED